jgi:ubiquinone/menaquinone biosynthesis C-methylase UbiE
MALLPDNFVDGVISISALEHNNHQDFTRCLNEILRVAKRGCILALTVSASQSEDWFHEPSKGWCYSESSLRNLFRLPITAKSNFTRKEEFMDKLRKEGNKLHKRLDAMYYRSGNNGMPWGKWDPRYQPVGIVTRKLEG